MKEKHLKEFYSVPDGYFDRLEERLVRIPSMSSDRGRGTFSGMKPYLSLAASFLFIFAVGTMVLKLASGTPEEDLTYLERIRLADLVPVTDPGLLYLQDGEDTEYDELEQYLIESGTTLEQLEYYYEGNN
ncbi:MAG: hypothetical protein MR793_00865 [Bacteroidales bacterium]|nr:hypothetical protein [Bacteroidales bacterium]MDY5781939.1 hypothetical protein [Candidatus Cryptobacteroides sp.]